MVSVWTLQLRLAVCLTLRSLVKGQTETPLLMFLIDGFRWDYMDAYQPGELPGLERFIGGGVKAEYLTPDFVTDSYPNYYTLMTGLYSENHGMVHNYMWDPLYPDQVFWIGSNEDQYNPHWWNDAEPFWISAERQGLSVYMWYWCGCEVEIRGMRPSYCYSYQDSGSPTQAELRQAIKEGIEVLGNGTADIAGIYFQEIDSQGHSQGPNGVDDAIRQLDHELDNMFQEIDQQDLDVNIVLFSDHGMNALDFENDPIDLLVYMNRSDADIFIWGSTTTQIWPYEGEEDWLYEKLHGAHPHLHVYRREETPEHWHHSDHRRISPLFLTVDEGWRMIAGPSFASPGNHGYDNTYEDMRGVFLAHGPGFKSGEVVGGFHGVDVYQAVCYLTAVSPEPHNGTWSNVCEMFADTGACEQYNDEA